MRQRYGYSPGGFAKAAQASEVIIFTFRHNEAVLAKPQAYGWIKAQDTRATGVSIKVPISQTPMEDHAVVGTFWFRRGSDFVAAADQMIAADDRINGEFYVDQVMDYLINADGTSASLRLRGITAGARRVIMKLTRIHSHIGLPLFRTSLGHHETIDCDPLL